MAILIALCFENGRMSAFRHGKEMMGMRRRLDGIDRDLDIAVGSVLETNRAGQTGRQFPVNLRFRRSRTNSAPADHVGYVLRADHIEVFRGSRQAQSIDVS